MTTDIVVCMISLYGSLSKTIINVAKCHILICIGNVCPYVQVTILVSWYKNSTTQYGTFAYQSHTL